MSPVTLRRLLSLARPELRPLTVGLVALVVSSGLSLLYPLVVQQIIDGIDTGGRALVDRATLLLLVLFAVGSALGAARAYLFSVAGERVVARLRQQLFDRVIHQEVAFFDRRRTGELTNRLASDTTVLQNTVTVNISMLLRFLIMSIGAVGFLFYTSWRLTLVTLFIVPVVAVLAGVTGRRIRRMSRDVQDALADSTTVAEEAISGVRTVRAFAAEEVESHRYAAAVERSFLVARRRAKLTSAFRGSLGFAGYATIAVVLWYGGHLLVDKVMTIGELTSYLLYTMTVAFSLGALSSLYEDLMKAMGASQRVFELLDRDPELVSGARRLPVVRGAVGLHAVLFHYPTRPDVAVLDRLDLTLEPGEAVALVGPSGGGKSTVAALLSRFYDPTEGRVTLDGIDYRELDSDWLRRQVGVVSQEPVLFATTIEENIRYGRPEATDAMVEAAARAANAHDFIADFPDGYRTRVGERGARLSGGQKQRVAIARALLKDPRVLILDEATSALDAESEALVQEALAVLMQGRTTLIIAHRLSTVREADRVVVLDGARVVQEGTHGELFGVEGIYRRLVQRQLSGSSHHA